MISESQLKFKRLFDLILSILLLPVLFVPIVILIIIASFDTKAYGIFSQDRVGQQGQIFKIYKIRTLKKGSHNLGELNKSASVLGNFFSQI